METVYERNEYEYIFKYHKNQISFSIHSQIDLVNCIVNIIHILQKQKKETKPREKISTHL